MLGGYAISSFVKGPHFVATFPKVNMITFFDYALNISWRAWLCVCWARTRPHVSWMHIHSKLIIRWYPLVPWSKLGLSADIQNGHQSTFMGFRQPYPIQINLEAVALRNPTGSCTMWQFVCLLSDEEIERKA